MGDGAPPAPLEASGERWQRRRAAAASAASAQACACLQVLRTWFLSKFQLKLHISNSHTSNPSHAAQVPRLTSMLRAALSSNGTSGGGGSGRASGSGRSGGSAAAPLVLPDLQQLLQQRARALDVRRQERADMQVSAARRELAGELLGGWQGVPKAARDTFDKFMQGGCVEVARYQQMRAQRMRLGCRFSDAPTKWR